MTETEPLPALFARASMPARRRSSQREKDDAGPPVPSEADGQVSTSCRRSSSVRRSAETLVVDNPEMKTTRFPLNQVASVVIHGNAQITTQAIHHVCRADIPIHWISGGGRYLTGLARGPGRVQRRIRQYQASTDPGVCLRLTRRLALARIEGQFATCCGDARRGRRGRADADLDLFASSCGRSRGRGVDTVRGQGAWRRATSRG